MVIFEASVRSLRGERKVGKPRKVARESKSGWGGDVKAHGGHLRTSVVRL